MAFVQLPGEGPYWPPMPTVLKTSAASRIDSTNYVIDATGEKVSMMGRFWHPSRTTASIRKIGFRFGSVTKAGGSALTVSLQDVSLTAGPPIQPDEVQDQTVAIANANAAFATDTWIMTDALSADRSIAHGALVSVVWEFDGAGRLGADTVAIAAWNTAANTLIPRQQRLSLKTAGAWAVQLEQVPVLFECADGTFGCLGANNWIFSSGVSVSLTTTTDPDEYAQRIVVTTPMKVDGAWIDVHTAAGADFEIILYEGTTAMTGGTVTHDSNAWDVDAVYRTSHVDFSQEIELRPGVVYYLAVKPTTANIVTVPVMVVDAAAHLAVAPGGTAWHAAGRVDAGAWTDVTTRRLFAGLRISSLEGGVFQRSHVIQNIGTY